VRMPVVASPDPSAVFFAESQLDDDVEQQRTRLRNRTYGRFPTLGLRKLQMPRAPLLPSCRSTLLASNSWSELVGRNRAALMSRRTKRRLFDHSPRKRSVT